LSCLKAHWVIYYEIYPKNVNKNSYLTQVRSALFSFKEKTQFSFVLNIAFVNTQNLCSINGGNYTNRRHDFQEFVFLCKFNILYSTAGDISARVSNLARQDSIFIG